MNLASNTAAGGFDYAVEGRRHPSHDRMLHSALDCREDLAGIAFDTSGG